MATETKEMDEKGLKEHHPSTPRLLEAEEEGGVWVPVEVVEMESPPQPWGPSPPSPGGTAPT